MTAHKPKIQQQPGHLKLLKNSIFRVPKSETRFSLCEGVLQKGDKYPVKTIQKWENQDGGVGRHTAPPRTTRTDRKSNGKEVRHQVDKKETYIQTGRRGRDGHRGREDSRGHGGTETGRVWDNGQAV